MRMHLYDFIIAGGGAAGLSLACQMIQSPLRDRSILIVDKDAKDRNDRTWCFWADRPTPFDPIVSCSWSRLRFMSRTYANVVDLQPYRYQMIRGIDFYRFARQELAAFPNVEFLHGTVERIADGDDYATVSIDGRTCHARWVFDSCFQLPSFVPDRTRYHYLHQRFAGWEIETPGAAFDPRIPTLLDFRTPQHGAIRFFYVLPLSARRALVEYVANTAPRQVDKDETSALQNYLHTVLEITDYRILAREGGASPLTDYPFPRRAGQRVIRIGTAGGRIKPTSGYAFMRMQDDSAAIVRSLLRRGHPFDLPPSSRRYRLYDAILLDLMAHHSADIGPIFTALFQHNPIRRVFRFLDEAGSLWENLLLIASLPPRRFVQALFRMYVLGSV
jgi:lycopene beta-cyclase